MIYLHTSEIEISVIGMDEKDTQRPLLAGFGDRLREERTRLGLSQTDLASIAGVRRLAQANYESERTSPPVRYLEIIAKSGVHIEYLLFGRISRSDTNEDDWEYLQRFQHAEQRAFELLDSFLSDNPLCRLGSDAKRIVFNSLRNNQLQIAAGKQIPELRPEDLIQPTFERKRA